MAENIQKCYPNGLWGNDSLLDRYNHIIQVLTIVNNNPHLFDDRDVNWLIKNAVLNKIYVSNNALKSLNNLTDPRAQQIINGIISNHSVGYTCIDIRKWTPTGIIFEHMIPGNVFLDEIKSLFFNGQLTYPAFQNIQSKVNVCLITSNEDVLLGKAGLRQKMPSNWDWSTGNPFARYINAGIQIY